MPLSTITQIYGLKLKRRPVLQQVLDAMAQMKEKGRLPKESWSTVKGSGKPDYESARKFMNSEMLYTYRSFLYPGAPAGMEFFTEDCHGEFYIGFEVFVLELVDGDLVSQTRDPLKLVEECEPAIVEFLAMYGSHVQDDKKRIHFVPEGRR